MFFSRLIAFAVLDELDWQIGYTELRGTRIAATSLLSSLLVALAYSMTCFCVLHTNAGLELAIDSFAARTVKFKDLAAAVEEWNKLQAILRQASTKFSGMFACLTLSCVASLILFAQRLLQAGGGLSRSEALLWVCFIYPPILLVCYMLASAASVSEKVTRVAPFINSWTFDATNILDTSRQYLVQYIQQSQAGYFIVSTRVTNFGVTKIVYYLLAGSFALMSAFLQER
mmetsp:Transcript_25359/g.58808  ORF Transcript_25359/g.58808 Transcript_25359/m.58808 type:complete len:229 (+) Transcript_25359:1154-1840(+)